LKQITFRILNFVKDDIYQNCSPCSYVKHKIYIELDAHKFFDLVIINIYFG